MADNATRVKRLLKYASHFKFLQVNQFQDLRPDFQSSYSSPVETIYVPGSKIQVKVNKMKGGDLVYKCLYTEYKNFKNLPN